MRILNIIVILVASYYSVAKAEITDTLKCEDKNSFPYAGVIVSGALIGYGVSGFFSDNVKRWNYEIRDDLQSPPHGKCRIDDFLWAAPALSAYILDWSGIRSRHNLVDKTILLASSVLLTELCVQSLKYTTDEIRPDGSSNTSFPSGHTALAFVSAEFLYREYKEHSIWYGVAGYAVASSVGFLRMYNNKHWLTDVAAGAGFGMLCTKMTYWAYPLIKEKINKKKKQPDIVLLPFANSRQQGFFITAAF